MAPRPAAQLAALLAAHRAARTAARLLASQLKPAHHLAEVGRAVGAPDAVRLFSGWFLLLDQELAAQQVWILYWNQIQ